MGQITVQGLGKAYKKYPNEWARLAEWVLPGHRQRHKLIWVLQNISFTVSPGEAVGIAGMNGAGKSTLLKLITGTAMPTTGSVEMTGRVAALLELGMGFDDDFTGRQNAYMSAQLLGHSVEEIEQMMPEIEAFAEIGDYMDRPVRMYSSGMQMRLAFSVATARRPDILIVDEALSVGDAYFQHKSFDRIRDYTEQGTTLLLVSHDKAAIQSICDRAVLLSEGKLAMEGEPESVMDFYNALLAERENYKVEQTVQEDGKTQTISGTGDVTLLSAELLDSDEQAIEVGSVGQSVSLRIRARCVYSIENLVVGYLIKDRLGQPVFGTNTFHHKSVLNHLDKGQDITIDFAFGLCIGEGSYSVTIAFHAGDTHVAKSYEWRDRVLVFSVINTSKEPFVGVAWLPPKVRWLP
ncbi:MULTISPECIES: ABC transporter ATP-binding protein [Halomonadaceae]|uniref:ATP-binding cassette domain-containing protein n=1 Tax=Vreelandella halophila TaxID=86177 RepID=A0A9X4Y8E2_9GAMM|nr:MULTISPECIES: ABC transporter ATP-binding protein [Halomonas]MYL25266.1 ATP-binding cassette domain-containing protein [Halomonas utahensis]MYL75328.1 ATP-binding cassette domain-containing protein [Halomonas sp. 22501_18_FS]